MSKEWILGWKFMTFYGLIDSGSCAVMWSFADMHCLIPQNDNSFSSHCVSNSACDDDDVHVQAGGWRGRRVFIRQPLCRPVSYHGIETLDADWLLTHHERRHPPRKHHQAARCDARS